MKTFALILLLLSMVATIAVLLLQGKIGHHLLFKEVKEIKKKINASAIILLIIVIMLSFVFVFVKNT
jgi:phosphatidylserine synthase